MQVKFTSYILYLEVKEIETQGEQKVEETNKFGRRLKSIRQNRKLSQEEFAFQCNMQASHIGQLERGQKSPTLETLKKISDGLNMPLTELLSFDKTDKLENRNVTVDKINAYLNKLTPKQQEQVLAIIKTFLD